jgi:hypothetical protein
MNSKTTLPLLDAAAHDEVVDVLRRLTVAYPDNTPNEVGCSVARCALEHAGVKVEAIDGRSSEVLKAWLDCPPAAVAQNQIVPSRSFIR